jgi:regulator of sirC expression with transglutaminase-like and TPR domain
LRLRDGREQKVNRVAKHEWYSTASVLELRELLTGESEHVPLDIAALQLASIEFPDVEVDDFLLLLDSHAREVEERISEHTSGPEFIQTLNEYLFFELGFRGNSDDYYNPSNSCLNEVLASRTGIPITLALVYMEISRRLGRTVLGIGLPGHFIVQYYDDDFTAFIDPFNSGRVLFDTECLNLAKEVTGVDVSRNPDVLRPVSKRHIVVRMLNNLRAAYFRRQNPSKAVQVLNLLIEAMPNSPEEYKQRGICLAQQQEFKAARRDLLAYLRLAPDAADRVQIEAQLTRINGWLSALQ